MACAQEDKDDEHVERDAEDGLRLLVALCFSFELPFNGYSVRLRRTTMTVALSAMRKTTCVLGCV